MGRMRNVKQAIIESLEERIRGGEIEVPPTSSLESFLGIRFGDDVGKYVDKDVSREENADEGTIDIDEAKGKQFLKFLEVGVCASQSDEKVVSVLARTGRYSIDDADKEAYKSETLRLLQRKYGMEPVRITFEDVRQKLDEFKFDISEIPEDIDDTVDLRVFSFYDDKKGRIVASISLVCVEGTFVLIARDEEAYRNLYQQEEQEQLDAL